jgi:hypothetical protein
MELAALILEESMCDPALREVTDKMIDDPEVTRIQLHHTAFAQGVISALEAINRGQVVLVPPTNS